MDKNTVLKEIRGLSATKASEDTGRSCENFERKCRLFCRIFLYSI